ncbi:hypothetical protein [Saccharothrix sp. ALI-22-I]|uniref:hypothetical protein n=1 Tax=Saccharothrix sp. ALI-22-I TaxID=1933778 RepID=UPI00117A1F65|nr:hypothetical protein [Saccharothrix sp. ALI-22-I]
MNDATGSTTTSYTVPLAEVERELGDELMQLARVLLDKAEGTAQPDDDHPPPESRHTKGSRPESLALTRFPGRVDNDAPTRRRGKS